MDQSKNIEVMLKGALEAASVITEDYFAISDVQIQKKGLKDYVTKTDLKAEEILISHFKKERPEYAILSEESGDVHGDSNGGNKYRWIIDPIDGTFNFMHNNPNFAISIALEQTIQDKREIVSSLIYLPITQELFWAEKNHGSYYSDSRGNRSKLNVSSRLDFEELSVVINFLEKIDTPQKEQFVKHIIDNKCQIRVSGSAVVDFAYLASGRHDILIQANLHPWDIAAGLLLIQEAGGQVMNYEGVLLELSDSNVIAGNSLLMDNMKKLCSFSSKEKLYNS